MFHFVRSTKAVVWTPSAFVQEPGNASRRTPEHIAKNLVYPDPVYYLALLGKYFFRSPLLRHLRVEQFNRYLMLTDADAARSTDITAENTIDVDVGADVYRVIDPDHRNYDPLLEATGPGVQFSSSMPGCPGWRRSHDSRFGVSRPPLLEPSVFLTPHALRKVEPSEFRRRNPDNANCESCKPRRLSAIQISAPTSGNCTQFFASAQITGRNACTRLGCPSGFLIRSCLMQAMNFGGVMYVTIC